MKLYIFPACLWTIPAFGSYSCEVWEAHSPINQMVTMYEPSIVLQSLDALIEKAMPLWHAFQEDHEMILCGDMFMAMFK